MILMRSYHKQKQSFSTTSTRKKIFLSLNDKLFLKKSLQLSLQYVLIHIIITKKIFFFSSTLFIIHYNFIWVLFSKCSASRWRHLENVYKFIRKYSSKLESREYKRYDDIKTENLLFNYKLRVRLCYCCLLFFLFVDCFFFTIEHNWNATLNA